MGLCLSCLQGNSDDEFDETSSLLRNQQQQQYITDYEQEESIKQQQQRQLELNSIVNELSDKLIDVTGFLSNQPSNGNLQAIKSNEENYDNDIYIYTESDRAKVKEQLESIDESIVKSTTIEVKQPLYLNF
ncbi:unnamed protein product [Candida verbasci]|uniref:Uncharacterized protein n=1 Tax=Candida verbasci TaxID=1227364 RepID=A0A9W4TQG6_9ASCO|nr:unnamed protein product [Candida verbasci]